MEANQVKTAADARRLVEQRNLTHVTVGVFDTDGILRSTCLSRQKFFSALDHGFEFCSLLLGWDSNDQPYDNVTFTGRHTGYPNIPMHIRPTTCRELPFEKSVLFLAEFAPPADAICPRAILRRVLNIAHDMELTPFASFAYEFYLFAETARSLRVKHYKDLQPLRPGQLGYSVLRNTVAGEFHQALLALCEAMDYPLESLHNASGPGMLEAVISVDNAEVAADKAALFKTFSKVLAQRSDLLATFMAKWSADHPGSSGYIHLSLKDSDGNAPFYDAKQPHNISQDLRHFIGGQQKLMPQLLAMMAPTVNAYTRLLSGYPAPTVASWGIENRTCALRVIPGDTDSQRVELRVAAADANPYIVLAAALASGLWGMENKIAPEAPVQGNAHEQTFSQALTLPTALWEATQMLKISQMARDWFGDAFVDYFTATREWETREFQKHISDWEISRYFEII
jgi:glutamine synthetase